MNDTTQINSELLSADAHGRKHIPVAVFAVILIHVVLFVVLLVAAGCRSTARAKVQPPEAAPTDYRPQLPKDYIAEATPMMNEAVVATEPVVEESLPAAPSEVALAPNPVEQQPVAVTAAAASSAPTVARQVTTRSTRNASVHVVQPGDTLGEIARRYGTTVQAVRRANKLKKDLIFPGQKLQLLPSGATPLQVKTQKSKRTNEA